MSEADGARVVVVDDEPAILRAVQTNLILVESPYRSLTGPLLAYIDALKDTQPTDTITVVLPEFVPSHWWEHLLHNQTALRLEAAQLFHPGLVVANVPYHMASQPAA